jgi:hypothetical protein
MAAFFFFVMLQVQQNQRDTAWASYTNILGFSVMGIWHDNTDGTDINAVCRCATNTASADTNIPNAVE